MSHQLPKLPYSSDALEPYIDANTMEIHHGKHHGTYVDKLNKTLEGHSNLQKRAIEELLSDLDSVPNDIRTAVRNNGGGHFNHSLFWKIMKKGGGGEPEEDLAEAIEVTFKSFKDFRTKFSQTALELFGSGWVWLSVRNGKLVLEAYPNQDNPLINPKGGQPIFGLDVWEHAYYLKCQNRRPEYVEAWWNVINWAEVAKNFSAATGKKPVSARRVSGAKRAA